MSIILELEEGGCIISHPDYINRLYENCVTESGSSYSVLEELFNIKEPYKTNISTPPHRGDNSSRKRKHNKTIHLDPKTQQIKEKFDNVMRLVKSYKVFTSNDKDLTANKCGSSVTSNTSARLAAETCSSVSLCLRGLDNCIGGNDASFALCQSLKMCDVLLPANCRFVYGDVRHTLSKLDGEKFDVITLDPPWWNKYIRRSKTKRPESSYEMLYNWEITNLPVGSLLADGGLVVVWCTNCPAHENDVKDVMFKKWGVQYKATWHWMKVTTDGQPVCPFTESTGKKPYEKIIIGVRDGGSTCKDIPESHMLISVPSALHSHKPPLNDVLAKHTTSTTPKYLEIFARYLLPNTTSLGSEPLRWQHSELFRKNLHKIQ